MEISGQLKAPAFLCEEKGPCSHWIGGFKADFNAAERRKFDFSCLESIPGSPVVRPVAWSLFQMSYPERIFVNIKKINNRIIL
jgi:hypothetical protein